MESKPEQFWKQALAVFVVCAAVYFTGFYATQHWRNRRGPWEVTFLTASNGTPLVEIAAPRLGITGVLLAFPGTNAPTMSTPTTVRFDEPARRNAPPFGRVKFLDTTVLPGTVTFDFFGHEVELLPRTLILDKREHPWRSGERVELPAR
jgi:hypothetical protein